jgi:sulfite oxidase
MTLPSGKDDARYTIHQDGPVNAEPEPALLLSDSKTDWTTPRSSMYMRNHGAVLHLPAEGYTLALEVDPVLADRFSSAAGFGGSASATAPTFVQERKDGRISLARLQDGMRDDRITLAAALQCAGNRRAEMGATKEVEGLPWGAGTVLNATWAGYPLRTFLQRLGLRGNNEDDELAYDRAHWNGAHVHFCSQQACEQADSYEASIPLADAMDPSRSVLLVDEMNGKPLPEEHGGPLRVIVPGFIGARSVKWLQTLRISEKPSENFYMTSDYKVLPPDVGPDEKEQAMGETEPLQATGLQSAVLTCVQEGERVQARGYALDGGGSPIERVEVCAVLDSEGLEERALIESSKEAEWIAATLTQEAKDKEEKVWSWTTWEASLAVQTEWRGKEIAVLCRATTADGTRQEAVTPW